MERVKGIEPSYSAWKAAALPLSYTRISGDPLTRQAGGLNRPGWLLLRAVNRPRPGPLGRRFALNSAGNLTYIEVFRNQRKEVIQCLVSSAVTSLGTPAELSWLCIGRPGA